VGGFGVLAWIAVGAAAGWVISRLMVDAEDDALRGTAAGMVGGILGGLGIRALDPSTLHSISLDASLAALAGSLWLTWITCVVTSGQQRDSGPPRSEVRVTVRDPAPLAEGARPTQTLAARTHAG
jgi:uncharacterized membrane protein YeaQ/YmgE (transglycosylase-associated protein family)